MTPGHPAAVNVRMTYALIIHYERMPNQRFLICNQFDLSLYSKSCVILNAYPYSIINVQVTSSDYASSITRLARFVVNYSKTSALNSFHDHITSPSFGISDLVLDHVLFLISAPVDEIDVKVLNLVYRFSTCVINMSLSRQKVRGAVIELFSAFRQILVSLSAWNEKESNMFVV